MTIAAQMHALVLTISYFCKSGDKLIDGNPTESLNGACNQLERL